MGVRSWEANLYSREQEWRERAEKAEADAARLREAIQTLNAVVETHKPTCSQCGKRWEYAACGPTHASIAAARATAEGKNDG
jgi:hypothetical protein